MIESILNIDPTLLEQFDCGVEPLNSFLKKYALKNDINNIGKTFVNTDGTKVVGFVTLCSAQLAFEQMPKTYKTSNPKYPVPCIRIARLAVDVNVQKCGNGRKLLAFAIKKALLASINVGIKGIVVDAKESSKAFYEQYGFVLLPNMGLTYFLPIESVINSL